MRNKYASTRKLFSAPFIAPTPGAAGTRLASLRGSSAAAEAAAAAAAAADAAELPHLRQHLVFFTSKASKIRCVAPEPPPSAVAAAEAARRSCVRIICTCVPEKAGTLSTCRSWRCRARQANASIAHAAHQHPRAPGIRQHTSANASMRTQVLNTRAHLACVSTRRHSSAYVSIHQHTPAYVSIGQHNMRYKYTSTRKLFSAPFIAPTPGAAGTRLASLRGSSAAAEAAAAAAAAADAAELPHLRQHLVFFTSKASKIRCVAPEPPPSAVAAAEAARRSCVRIICTCVPEKAGTLSTCRSWRCRARQANASIAHAAHQHPRAPGIRQHTSANASMRTQVLNTRAHLACVSTRRHSSAYVSIHQHTPAYVSIGQHTSASTALNTRAHLAIRLLQHTAAGVSMPA